MYLLRLELIVGVKRPVVVFSERSLVVHDFAPEAHSVVDHKESTLQLHRADSRQVEECVGHLVKAGGPLAEVELGFFVEGLQHADERELHGAFRSQSPSLLFLLQQRLAIKALDGELRKFHPPLKTLYQFFDWQTRHDADIVALRAFLFLHPVLRRPEPNDRPHVLDAIGITRPAGKFVVEFLQVEIALRLANSRKQQPFNPF